MNKEIYLRELGLALAQISVEERADILQDFEEHFQNGLKEGKTEAEISAALGSPNKIAQEMLDGIYIEKVKPTTSAGDSVRTIWIIIGLVFFNLTIVLGPLVGLIGILFGGWVLGFAFIISPLLVGLNAVIYSEPFMLYDLFVSILLTGVGLLILIGMFYATRALIKVIVRYVQFNTKLVKGGVKDV